MSYCRFSSGDAYIIRRIDGKIECIACRLLPKRDWYGDFSCKTSKEMLIHIKKHQDIGHKIPKHAIDRLKREAKND
jgi:hypothetical protein